MMSYSYSLQLWHHRTVKLINDIPMTTVSLLTLICMYLYKLVIGVLLLVHIQYPSTVTTNRLSRFIRNRSSACRFTKVYAFAIPTIRQQATVIVDSPDTLFMKWRLRPDLCGTPFGHLLNLTSRRFHGILSRPLCRHPLKTRLWHTAPWILLAVFCLLTKQCGSLESRCFLCSIVFSVSFCPGHSHSDQPLRL